MLIRPAFAPFTAALLLTVAAVPLTARAAAPIEADAPQPGDRAEARAENVIIEDDGSRIEELHLRGEVTRIHVQPKRGAAYEIVPANAGRGPANSPGNSGAGSSSAGQRLWSIFRF